ncbi:MAG: hypothetical protein OXT09_17225 [Myxococcales bacterium]|nr:hypothetical protein [Myxococcales bacterium]
MIVALVLVSAAPAVARECETAIEGGGCELAGSRWVATVPFGVGQFQNGDDRLGAFLLITETVLLGASVTFWVLHEDIARVEHVRADDVDQVRRREEQYRWGNRVALALFGGTVLAGIIEAQLSLGAVDATMVAGPTSAHLSLRY